ncbi:pimeloyl-ACP methyl ester carboxylesterase [Inquilinus ginsengisoli]|uniref:Pimeloyl-ACP methyl ester carboxylesterase n=1 Tax=Inquilinus ginsengisoli TaxID=363840 RepID=A0ABU1JWK2_9PROT|nr:epoxide hydrolase [Inquilinus ginsengisoli]MDR6292677.1 pimeloyl-ACP methyl ester carboxylesterase [Inquilinus ginsengisoli]
MSEDLPSPTRRGFLATSATAVLAASAAGAFSLFPMRQAAAASGSAIRPFQVAVPDADLDDLRRRILATRWPAKETVADQSQGVQLARLQKLVRYWGTEYDWRKVEAKLNTLPMFVTEIDGLDIQFIHVSSKHPDALPLIMTHGWPGSILELLKVIGPLTDPTAHGGSAADAFHLVVPSLPGFGFSGKPQETGWGSDHIARAWGELMGRLGYTRFVSQGGDCGSVVSHRMAMQGVPGLIGIHVNMPATVPAELQPLLAQGLPAPASLSAKEKAAYDKLNDFYKNNSAYAAMMVTRPQTLGYSLVDSPVGQAAWMYDKIAQWTFSGGDPERSLTRDEILDDISLYWLTDSSTSAAQIYWEDHSNNFNAVDISLPAAVTVFPGEIYQAPRSWVERSYHKLIHFNEVDKGGHFAAWEEPELFSTEIRAAFRSLR